MPLPGMGRGMWPMGAGLNAELNARLQKQRQAE